MALRQLYFRRHDLDAAHFPAYFGRDIGVPYDFVRQLRTRRHDLGAAQFPAYYDRDMGMPAICANSPEARYGRHPRLAAALRVRLFLSDSRQLDTGGVLKLAAALPSRIRRTGAAHSVPLGYRSRGRRRGAPVALYPPLIFIFPSFFTFSFLSFLPPARKTRHMPYTYPNIRRG